MTLVDWIALAIVAIAALAGMQRGLILSACSLAGLALGAYVGARVAPHLLSGGAGSIWTPIPRRLPRPWDRMPCLASDCPAPWTASSWPCARCWASR